MSRFFRRAADSDSDSSDSSLSSDEESLLSDDLSGSDVPKKPSTKKTKPSKAVGSDSDASTSASESESESDSDDSDRQQNKAAKAAPVASRFLRGGKSDESDSDEDVVRVVKSAADRRNDELQAVGKTIENALRIDDWLVISKEYDSLLRMVQKETNVGKPVPANFISITIKLEDAQATAVAKDRAATKKMKAPVAKALNTVKQRVRKSLKEYETLVNKCKEDPEAFAAEQARLAAPPPETVPARNRQGPTVPGDEAEENKDEAGQFQQVGRGGRAMVFTTEGLFKQLHTVMVARGKKNTDREEQIFILTKLLEVAGTPYQEIRVLLALISARFDYNSSMNAYMTIEMWKKARQEVGQLIRVLTNNTGYIVQEVTEDYDDSIDRVPNVDGQGPVVHVRGSLVSFIERLDDELTKSLQNIDPHASDYVERLSDEKLLYATIVQAQVYLERLDQVDNLCRVVIRRLEHIYSKPVAVIRLLEQYRNQADAPEGTTTQDTTNVSDPASVIRALCLKLYKDGSSLLRTRAIVFHVYHHALHDDYHLARDMLLMSHVQDTVHAADAGTQILYNRAVVQLGLAAFRLGLIKECQNALQDIFGTGRVKELLAQGIQRANPYVTISAEQEKIDRQRQLPFHLHINMELLECVYLTCSMLLEVPQMAYAGNDAEKRKKVISKPFRRMLEFSERQVFTGPPENTRDHIMQATKALQAGNWKKCIELVNGIAIWKLMAKADQVKSILAKKIQEEGLRTYLFSYSSYFVTLSLSHLSDTFELPLATIKSIISKLIWTDKLSGSLTTSPSTGLDLLVLHSSVSDMGTNVQGGGENAKIQTLAGLLAEKAVGLLEANERIFDSKVAAFEGSNIAGGGYVPATSGGGAGGGIGEKDRRGERREGRGRGGYRGRGRGTGFGGRDSFQSFGRRIGV